MSTEGQKERATQNRVIKRHNDRFVAYMGKFMPNWQSRRRELNSFPVSHADWGY